MAILLFSSAGCTMLSLERHTAEQTASTDDLRYREVMENLARSAANPSVLPSYATIYSGSVQVSDTLGIISTTAWQHVVAAPVQNGFSSEMANPSEQRQIQQNWALDPIIHSSKLEAMRACAKWVLLGQGSLDEEEIGLLISPDVAAPGPHRHFDVVSRLAALPEGWLHVGGLRDVPVHACYKAHCGKTWVWVDQAGMKGLANYCLILQDIGRVNINSPSLFTLPPTYSFMNFATLDSPVRTDKDVRFVRMYAVVYVDPSGHLLPDVPYTYQQQEVQQSLSLSHLRSIINLAVPTPH
jgi:hypothetical protein